MQWEVLFLVLYKEIKMDILALISFYLFINTWITLLIGVYDDCLIGKEDLFYMLICTIMSPPLFFLLKYIIAYIKKKRRGK